MPTGARKNYPPILQPCTRSMCMGGWVVGSCEQSHVLELGWDTEATHTVLKEKLGEADSGVLVLGAGRLAGDIQRGAAIVRLGKVHVGP